jgi:import inner membrane translocase subunit TIM22
MSASSSTRARATKQQSAALQLEISDSNQTAVEVSSRSDDFEFKTPCTLTGIGAGVSSAMLGYVFGFGGYWISQRSKGALQLANQAGLGSARTFAILGGLYSGVSCFMSRLRQKNDAFNAGVSGCSTGLVLGWTSGGPIAAVQSCAMFGLFSYFLDGTGGGGGVGSAEACDLGIMNTRVGGKKQVVGEREVLLPSLPLPQSLTMTQCSYFR